MRSSSAEKIVTVDGKTCATVIVLWWASSLIVVRAVLETGAATPFLEWVQQAVPAAQKFARDSGFAEAATAFYCYFLLTSPFVAVYYFRFTTVTRALGTGVKVIMWLMIPWAVFCMTVGVDMGASESKGFQRTFNIVLTSSWFGSSFIFLLFCHCLLAAIACVAKDREIRVSLAQ
jgi:hypothetical protein